MGYRHILNLYADPAFVGSTKEVYALEKLHGTSAHVRWNEGSVSFFAGGEKHENFVKLFDADDLKLRFEVLGYASCVVYGEAYGGKQQGMRNTYGDNLKFAAFDVLADGTWLETPDACLVACALKLEFVNFERGPNKLEWLDAQRDKPSTQAKRNGIQEDKHSEGVVIRPVPTQLNHHGYPIIYKHKRAEFRETKTPREVDPEKVKVLETARAVADEYVTEERLRHVLAHEQARLGREPEVTDTGDVIREMIDDIKRESLPSENITWNQETHRAIGVKTAQIFKKSLQGRLAKQ